MRGKRSSSSSSTSPCAPLRDAYHTCFNRWYAEKFLKGHWDKEECVSEWQKYRACLSENLEDKHLIRFLEAEGNVQHDHRKGAAAAAAEGSPLYILHEGISNHELLPLQFLDVQTIPAHSSSVLQFPKEIVAKTIIPLSSGIDLESMGIVQRDALLVFRTFCKMGMKEDNDEVTTKTRILSLEFL